MTPALGKPNSVAIRTGCRLHVGFLADHPRLPRRHGGLGLMLADPGVSAEAAPATDGDRFTANPPELLPRVERTLAELRGRHAAVRDLGPLAVRLHSTIPQHAGLGSGTQLHCALAAAVLRLAGRSDLAARPDVLAEQATRGRRSSVGVHGFLRGGLLFEAGRPTGAGAPDPPPTVAPLLFQADLPAAWRVVLLTTDTPGLSGDRETQALAAAPPMPPALTDRLARLLLLDLLPAAREADFASLRTAIHAYGTAVGEHFAPLQGGLFADPALRRLAAALPGVPLVQSSWGPTLALLCESETDAEAATQQIATAADSLLGTDHAVRTEDPAILTSLFQDRSGFAGCQGWADIGLAKRPIHLRADF